MTALGTVWPRPECVLLGHPRSPRSTVLRGQLHFLLPRFGGHCCQLCLPELMVCTAGPSVSPTHQAGHWGPPQGALSGHWHFPGQLWAPGPRTRGWTEGRRCTGIHCGGKDSITQLQRYGVQGGERAGVAPQRPGGRKEGRDSVFTRPPCLVVLGPGPLPCSATTVRRGLGFPFARSECGDPTRLGVRRGQGQSQPTLHRVKEGPCLLPCLPRCCPGPPLLTKGSGWASA